MRIGFDFDGTITKAPFIFKILVESLKDQHELYLISGTSIEDKSKLLSELKYYNICESNFKEIICKPEYGGLELTTDWKVDVIDKYKIRLYFENRFVTAEKIAELCNVFYIF